MGRMITTMGVSSGQSERKSLYCFLFIYDDNVGRKSSLRIWLKLPWWLGSKELSCQCRRIGFHPWVGKFPWRRKWQLTPVCLPGKSQEQRSLAGYSPQRVKSDLATKQQQKGCFSLGLPPKLLTPKYSCLLKISLQYLIQCCLNCGPLTGVHPQIICYLQQTKYKNENEFNNFYSNFTSPHSSPSAIFLIHCTRCRPV